MALDRDLRFAAFETTGDGSAPGDFVGGLVLCGGRSSRLGTNKALIRLDTREEMFIQGVIAAVSAVARRILLSCGDPKEYAFLGLDNVADAIENAGPLGGIVAGLEAMPSAPWILVAACDLPFATPRMSRSLVSRANAYPEADVVMPATEKGDEPLFALYKPSVARILRHAAARGTFRLAPRRRLAGEADLTSFALEGARVERVSLQDLDLGDVPNGSSAVALLNVNDPIQLTEANEIAATWRAQSNPGPGPKSVNDTVRGR